MNNINLKFTLITLLGQVNREKNKNLILQKRTVTLLSHYLNLSLDELNCTI